MGTDMRCLWLKYTETYDNTNGPEFSGSPVQIMDRGNLQPNLSTAGNWPPPCCHALSHPASLSPRRKNPQPWFLNTWVSTLSAQNPKWLPQFEEKTGSLSWKQPSDNIQRSSDSWHRFKHAHWEYSYQEMKAGWLDQDWGLVCFQMISARTKEDFNVPDCTDEDWRLRWSQYWMWPSGVPAPPLTYVMMRWQALSTLLQFLCRTDE